MPHDRRENTFQAIAEEFFKRAGAELRTGARRQQDLERMAYPKLDGRDAPEIRRSDIVRLLDQMADERGPVMADRLLSGIRRILNWHATRSDDFVSPIVRGMAAKAYVPRQRILTDDEVRAIWMAVGDFPAVYHALVKFLLLTHGRPAK